MEIKKNDRETTHRNSKVNVAVAVVLASVVLRNATYSTDPWSFLLPNFLMFTPLRKATLSSWTNVLTYGPEEKEPVPIPEIEAKNFSMEALRAATNGFLSPVVVRGLFRDTTALKRWTEPGYMAEKIGRHKVTSIQKNFADVMDDERECQKEYFGDVFAEMLANENSTKYLFFPDASQASDNLVSIFADDSLKTNVNNMVREDLDLDRIWPTFGTKAHRTFIVAQIIAGRGFPSSMRPSGSNWHCAIGHNWFAQVVGSKRWYFLDQKHSAYMKPMRAGVNSFFTGSKEMGELQKYLPLKFVDLYPGDLLYNPDFEWHTVINYPGFSIGVPIREFNLTTALKNNAQYTLIVGINNLLSEVFGISYGLSN